MSKLMLVAVALGLSVFCMYGCGSESIEPNAGAAGHVPISDVLVGIGPSASDAGVGVTSEALTLLQGTGWQWWTANCPANYGWQDSYDTNSDFYANLNTSQGVTSYTAYAPYCTSTKCQWAMKKELFDTSGFRISSTYVGTLTCINDGTPHCWLG